MNLGTAAEVTYNTCKTPPMTSNITRVAPPMTSEVKGQRWCAPPIRGQLWSLITTLLLVDSRAAIIMGNKSVSSVDAAHGV